jgi:hypothetical protein
MIQTNNKVDAWLSWTDDVTHRIISSIQVLQNAQVAKGVFLVDAVKEFVLKWNFYSGLILRELTMKSSNSFGTQDVVELIVRDVPFAQDTAG